jgi:integrase
LRVEEVQAYLLHLIRDKKLAYASVNQASCAFRFLYRRVLGRPEAGFDIPMAKVPQRLPQILSREEVARLIDSARTLRGRTLLMTTYAAGLRVSEVCALQVGDIESAADRMCLKVRQGKGGKDRYTLLSPHLLAALRTYWRDTRPRLWLFPTGPAPARWKSRPPSGSTMRHATPRASPPKAASTVFAMPSPRTCSKPASISTASAGSSAMVICRRPRAICIWRAQS